MRNNLKLGKCEIVENWEKMPGGELNPRPPAASNLYLPLSY